MLLSLAWLARFWCIRWFDPLDIGQPSATHGVGLHRWRQLVEDTLALLTHHRGHSDWMLMILRGRAPATLRQSRWMITRPWLAHLLVLVTFFLCPALQVHHLREVLEVGDCLLAWRVLRCSVTSIAIRVTRCTFRHRLRMHPLLRDATIS